MTQAARARTGTWPEKLLVREEALDDPMTKRIIDKLSGHAEISTFSDSGDPLSEIAASEGVSDAERFTRGKRTLLLQHHKGAWLKACPGTSGHVCCNLWIVNPGEGCPFDCTYCYLQSYLKRNPTLKLYTNTSSLLEEIERRATAEPNRLFRVGTGELIDSLVWDDLTEQTLEFVPFFARIPNLLLELKSKDDYVENLLSLRDQHQGKTVVSWSVNARSITERDERSTASLSQRIAAAEKVVDAGYRVGFHFDPLVHFEGWEDEYRDTISAIFSRIPAERVAWVSVSSLRYRPDLQEMMLARFPESKIPFGEQFLAKDRKIRYVQPLRFRMLHFVRDQLLAVRKELPVYMCMESSTAWRQITGGAPVAGSELSEVFSRKGRLPILQDGGRAEGV